MILSVTTTYMVQLNESVILTDEYHYPDPTRNLTRATYEVTDARVITAPGSEPNVELLGYALLPSGARSKKNKGKVAYVPRVSILTQHSDYSHTNDTSAYDAVVAAVLAEVAAATPATIGA